MIENIALRILRERPDYESFENNCQNFTKYLVESISPGSFSHKTIRQVLDRWQVLADDAREHFPGTYADSVDSEATQTATYSAVSRGIELMSIQSGDSFLHPRMSHDDADSGANSLSPSTDLNSDAGVTQ